MRAVCAAVWLLGAAVVSLAPGCRHRTAAPPAAAGNDADPALPGVASPSRALEHRLRAALAARGPGFRPMTRDRAPDGTARYVNRLILESSPYLLEHANNPVNWYSWSDQPFERARREHKPVLVSIGYSTCHWCHVMERESFDDEEVARFLNQHFVCIKVDREERPAIDALYMKAVLAMTGDGGWPMTVFLTPDRQPFYGGTYFPRDRFLAVLHQVSQRYRAKPDAIASQAAEVTRAIETATRVPPPGDLPGAAVLGQLARQLEAAADRDWGGFGSGAKGAKFPQPHMCSLLLRAYRRTGDRAALTAVTTTLDRMARGGIYDQVGGGFHRYALDRRWWIPHFEKMLYTNAELVPLYLEAYQVTGRAEFRRVAQETLDYVAREMTSPAGGFYSATDADSRDPTGRDREGYFFTWTAAEIRRAVGPADAALALGTFGLGDHVEVDGRAVLHRAVAPADRAHGAEPPSWAGQPERVARIRQALLAARSRRAPPRRDDKILTAENGLMISAFTDSARVLGRPDYQRAATRAADLLWDTRRGPTGLLLRTAHAKADRIPTTLDDQVFVIAAFLDLFETTGESRWLDRAIALQAALDAHFLDATGGYFGTSRGGSSLLVRDKPIEDGPEPSGNGIAALNLLRLAELTSRPAYHSEAQSLLRAFAGPMRKEPFAVPRLLEALDVAQGPPLEIAIIAPPGADSQALLDVVDATYLASRVLVRTTEGAPLTDLARRIPWLAGKRAMAGHATAYLCRHGACQLPTTDPAVLKRQLEHATAVR